MIVGQGKAISEEALRLLREEHQALRGETHWGREWARFFGFLAVVGVLWTCIYFYLCVYHPAVANDQRQLMGLCVGSTTALLLARLLMIPPYYAEILPIAVRVALGGRL